jgi:Holliday junction DNA helicase RuvA
MIYSLSGTIKEKKERFGVVEVGGIGFKISTNERTLRNMPASGKPVSLYCHLHVREDALELYGFLDEAALKFFEQLVSVSGVGPKSAIAVMDIAPLTELTAAISENRPDLLTRASGIGRKTAERIIIDLRSKVRNKEAEVTVKKMEGDADLVESLVGLGYKRDQARSALDKVASNVMGIEDRLKAALKVLGKH